MYNLLYTYTQHLCRVARALVSYAREARKFGVGLVLVSQRPSDVDSKILSQCNSIFAFRQNDSNDVEKIAGRMGSFKNLVGSLYSLPDRRAMALIAGAVAPLEVEVTLME